jgi:hypothetical protein
MKGRILGILFLIPGIIFTADAAEDNGTVRIKPGDDSHSAGYRRALIGDSEIDAALSKAEREEKREVERKERRDRFIETMQKNNPLARVALQFNKKEEEEARQRKAQKTLKELDSAGLVTAEAYLRELDAALTAESVQDQLDGDGNLILDPNASRRASPDGTKSKKVELKTDDDDDLAVPTRTGSGKLASELQRQLKEARGLNVSYTSQRSDPPVVVQQAIDQVGVASRREARQRNKKRGCITGCIVL